MTSRNTPTRIASITALVITGIAFLAAGVSSVVVTLWVLLIAVPLLGTLLLVRNLLNGASHDTPASIAGITALVIIGIAFLAAGVSSVVTLWTSTFARFLYLEDLGLEGTPAAAVARVTPVDRGLLIFGAILALFGAAALIAAALLARWRKRAGL
jgi:hypothetical protein